MIKLPPRYPFAEKVPQGGSSCANCYFLSKDGEHCRNRFYRQSEGTRKLGAKADQFCCCAWSGEARQ